MTRASSTASAAAPVDGLGAADAAGTTILTGEAVHLDVRVAGVGSRGVARLVDLVVQVFLAYLLQSFGGFVIILLLAFGLVVPDTALVAAMLTLILITVFVGYPVFFETVARGRTPGKMVLGLRVVRDDGGPVTFRQTLTRALVAVSIEWPGLLLLPFTWIIPIWAMIASPRSKRLGDHVAGTIVVHERAPTAWGWVPVMPPSLAMWAATLDLTGLDDDLALAVRAFLARNRRLREPARSVLGERLVREVAAVTNPPPPYGTPAWMYLAAVHAERHGRAMRQLASVRSRAAMVWPELTAAVAPPPRTPPPAPRSRRDRAASPPPAQATPPRMPTVRPAQLKSEPPQ